MRFLKLNRLPPVLVLIGVCPFLLVAAAVPAHADVNQQAAADKLDVVRQAFDLLYTGFVDPVADDQLLNDAWTGINSALTADGQATVTPPALTGDPEADWTAFTNAYRRLVATNVAPVRDIAYGAIARMAAARNSCHTTFLPPEYANVENGELAHQPTTFTGFVFGREDFIVYRVYADSPAERAGIRPGDKILTANGMGSPGLGRRIAYAPAGKPLPITLKRPGEPDPVAVTLVPELTVLPFIRTTVLPGGIGVIEFDTFTAGAGLQAAIRDALADFEAQGVVGWVLDLRTNAGGDGNSMAAIASLFLGSGRVITIIDRAGGTQDVAVDGRSMVQPQRPLVVLTERYSASAADMLPGALQDNGRAYIIGDRSDGCVSSSTIRDLADGSLLQVESSRVLVGNDDLDLDGVGVTPDETIVRTPEILASGADPQMDSAVEHLLSVAGR